MKEQNKPTFLGRVLQIKNAALILASLFILFALSQLFMFIAPTGPVLVQYDEYQNLENWDLSMHASGDFDQDGHEDFITFTGCAFLSRTPEDSIPKNKQCTAPGMALLKEYLTNESIGQRTAHPKDGDYSFDAWIHSPHVEYSYIARQDGEPWYVYVKETGKFFRRYQITNSGELIQEGVSLLEFLDFLIYQVSLLLLLPAFIFMHISYLFYLIFQY